MAQTLAPAPVIPGQAHAEWPESLDDPARAALWLAELQRAAALRGLTAVLEASR